MLAGNAILIFLASQNIRNALFKSGLGVQIQISCCHLKEIISSNKYIIVMAIRVVEFSNGRYKD